MATTVEKKYLLDFSGLQYGGVPGGTFNNFAFNVDVHRPVRKISVSTAQQRTEVIATYDYADCTKGQEPLLENPLHGLSAGDAVWVDYVDIEIRPPSRGDPKWTGGVCYGYRKPSGKWYWNLVSTPLTYDSATKLIRARIWVKEADINAFKLVFDYSVPRQYVSAVTVTVQQAEAKPGK